MGDITQIDVQLPHPVQLISCAMAVTVGREGLLCLMRQSHIRHTVQNELPQTTI